MGICDSGQSAGPPEPETPMLYSPYPSKRQDSSESALTLRIPGIPKQSTRDGLK